MKNRTGLNFLLATSLLISSVGGFCPVAAFAETKDAKVPTQNLNPGDTGLEADEVEISDAEAAKLTQTNNAPVNTPPVFTPPYLAEDTQANKDTKKEPTDEQAKMLNFVSKYEVDLNSDKNYVFDINSASITLTVDTGKVARITINGIEIDQTRLGKTQVNKVTGKTSYTYYGIALNEGKNIIKADIQGYKNEEYSKEVFVKGRPASITVEKSRIQADGKTPGDIVVYVKDKWDNPVVDGTFVTVTLNIGEMKSEDKDFNTSGLQIATKDGKAVLTIMPPNSVDTAKVQFLSGEVKFEDNIDYATPLREPIFMALGKGRSNYSFLNGNTLSDDPKGVAGFNYNLGLNLFTQGTIFNDYLLTAAANTERKLNALDDDQNILLRDRAEDRTYPIYGDSSQLNQVAVANSNFYFKLEKEKSSLLWGDFTTAPSTVETTAPTMSNYNRVLTGAKLDLNLPGITNVQLFGAMSNQAFDRDEIRGAGVSGPYYTSKYPLVNGSERISIETRDRTISNKILTTKTLNRLSDYNIDYTNGSIVFSQPVPTFDENLNPNYIVVTYEFYPNSVNNSIVGGTIHQPLPFLGAFVGGSYIREISTNPYQLFGGNFGSKIGDAFDFIAEYANSNFEKKVGSSYRAALTSKVKDNLSLNGEYVYVDPNFVNQTGASFTAGSERYLLRGTYKPFDSTSLNLEYNRNNNFLSSQLIQTVNANVSQDIFANIITLGFEGRNFPDPLKPTTTLNAGLINIGYKSPTIYNISFNAKREQNIFGAVDQLKPTLTSVGLDYALTNNVKLYARQDFLEKDKLVTATAVGVDTGFTRESNFLNAVNVGAKYQIDGALDGRSGQTRIGLNNKITVLPELALGVAYERVSGNSPVLNLTDDHNAWSFSADYTPSYIGLRASGKYDMRDGTNASRLYSFNAAGALGDDFGLFGRFNMSSSADLSRRSSTEGLFGLAYRPLSNDFFNALLKYQVKNSDTGIVQLSNVTNHVASFEGFFQPAYAWEIYTKLALKNSWDKTADYNPVASNISLGLARVTYKFFYNFDIVGEYRNLTQYETATSFNDFTAEVGYYPIKDLRVGVGYNLFGYNDKDLAASNYTAQGPYVSVALKLNSLGSWWGQEGVLTSKDIKAEKAAIANKEDVKTDKEIKDTKIVNEVPVKEIKDTKIVNEVPVKEIKSEKETSVIKEIKVEKVTPISRNINAEREIAIINGIKSDKEIPANNAKLEKVSFVIKDTKVEKVLPVINAVKIEKEVSITKDIKTEKKSSIISKIKNNFLVSRLSELRKKVRTEKISAQEKKLLVSRILKLKKKLLIVNVSKTKKDS